MRLPLFLWLTVACSGVEAPDGAGPRPAAVQVSSARTGELSDTWTMLGEVQALERAELSAGASGAVTSVAAREGDSVDQGTVLVEVDPALASAELAVARAEERRLGAELDQARRTVERVGRVQSGVLAASEVEQADTRVAMLQAQVEGAEASTRLAGARLARHRVKAPFPGVVARRHVDPGDWVDPGEPVVDLVRTDGVEVRVDAPLELASRVAVGDRVGLGPGRTGTIVGLVPALDPVSRTSVLRIAPDPDSVPGVPGSAIEVVFDVQMSGGVLVPRDALVAGPTETRVFRVVDGTAHALTVEVLASTADEVLVKVDGLEPGDQVVVRGNERLRPEQPVQVAP